MAGERKQSCERGHEGREEVTGYRLRWSKKAKKVKEGEEVEE